MPIVIQEHAFDMRRAWRLVQRISDALTREPATRAIEAEMALLLTYSYGADGTKTYPAETADARKQLVAVRGARLLCAAIAQVGALSDAEVLREVSLSARPATTN